MLWLDWLADNWQRVQAFTRGDLDILDRVVYRHLPSLVDRWDPTIVENMDQYLWSMLGRYRLKYWMRLRERQAVSLGEIDLPTKPDGDQHFEVLDFLEGSGLEYGDQMLVYWVVICDYTLAEVASHLSVSRAVVSRRLRIVLDELADGDLEALRGSKSVASSGH